MEKVVNFRNSRGTKLVGILDNPSGKKDGPIFVLCHGHGSGKNSQTFLSLKEKLNRQGVATLRFDFFGHGESEGRFEDINATQAIDDISSAINFLKAEGYNKIGLVGSSLGAFASTIVAARTPEVLALALKSPTFDFTIWKSRMIGKFGQQWEQIQAIDFKTSSVQARLDQSLLDAFVRDADQYDVFGNAHKVNVPVLIVHGEKDETVPLETSKKMASLMPRATLTVIAGADHEYTTGNTFNEMIDALVEFLAKQK